jgi:hypothetical protein
MNKKKICLLIALMISMLIVIVPIQPANARLILNNEFSPSAVTYTNKTIHFQEGDPYNGYSYWTYEKDGSVQGPSDNKYYMNTDTNGYAEYFGFDEFVNHSIVSAQIIFRTSLIVGTYHFQPLGYFYQKTALESNTHWALAINWSSSGIDLVYNTGNGNTPTEVNLVGTAPIQGTNYKCVLSNLGDQTFVEITAVTPTHYQFMSTIYSGYTTTERYDATSLYAGFGQYSSGDGNMYGVSDDFCIIDSTYTYSPDGTGFRTIDAYVDEVFTQTLYDYDGEGNSILTIDDSVTNITLLVDCWLNSTTYGISTLAEGKNIIRHNITVTSVNSTVVFSQSNLTYVASADYGDNVFLYQYSVYLDFTIMYGEIYTAIITYEIFWKEF